MLNRNKAPDSGTEYYENKERLTKCFVNIKSNTNYSDYCCPYLKGHLDLFLRLVATSGGNKVNKQHSSGSK